MRNILQINPSTLVLARGELVSFRPRGRRFRIACVTGRLWVTASGRQEDTVLAPGDVAACAGKGRVVVEALRTATVRIATEQVRARSPLPLGRLPDGLFS
jgi:hypothetical protein